MASPSGGPGTPPFESALEIELRRLVAESGAAAGALCLLDDRVGGLRLVADVGLSDEGCQHLRALGRAGGGSWSLPLESLCAREPRAEASATAASPLPPLLDPPGAPATVLCLPLVAGEVALGSVILVARPPSALQVDGRRLDPALARLTHVAEELLRRIPDASRTTSRSVLDTLVSRALDAVARVVDEVAGLIAAAASFASFRRRQEAPMPDAASMLEAMRSERDRLLAERAAAAAAHAAERARLAAHLDEAEATWSRSVRVAEEHVRLEMQAQLDAHVARSAADREETMRHARELVQRSEQQRAAVAAEGAEAGRALVEARAHSMALEGDLARLEERTRRLEAAIEAAATDRTRLERSLTEWRDAAVRAREEASQAREEAEAQQADGRRSALAMAEVDRAGAARIAELSAEMDELARQRDRVTGERDTALAQIRRLHEEHDAYQMQAASDREELLRAALTANEATEAARAAAVAELAVVRDALGKSQGLILELEEDQARRAELERARRAIADSEAARLAAEDRVRALQADVGRFAAVEQDLERTAAEAAAARAAAVEAAGRADVRGRELVRAEAAIERAEAVARREAEAASLTSARLRELEALLAEKLVELADLGATLGDAVATLDEARARERQRTEELRAAERVAAEHDDALRRALALSRASDEVRAVAVDETEALRGALASAQCKLLAAEDEARYVRETVDRLELGARQAAEERERLVVAADEARHRVATLGARIAELEAAIAAEQLRKSSGGRAPDVVVSESAPAARRAASGRADVLVVLDGTAVWALESGDAARLVSMSPSDRDVAQLECAGGMIVNLAAPGALNAVAAARRAGGMLRLWGCVTRGATGPALPMGALELLEAPLDPAQALVTLRPYFASRRRVLAVGSDGPGLLALRQALMRVGGTSVSIGWDAKQALDLLEVVRPEIVVVDLALRGAHALVAEVAAAASGPLVVLIPTGDGDEAAFATMAIPLLSGRRAVPRDAIVARAFAALQRETSSKVGMLERARDLR